MNPDAALQRLWYGTHWLSVPLWPLGGLFRAGVAVRRGLYSIGALRTRHVAVPVVVVGNVTVGGTGKTPVTAWLARQLELRGHRVGVVLRGYGGSGGPPRVVRHDDAAAEVGDEAVLHALRRPHVVVAAADRVAAARLAVEQGASVIVCDDGLQHLRLARDCEVAVLDAERGLGNRHMLPAGPLREPARRLERVHAVVLTRRGADGTSRWRPAQPMTIEMRLQPGEAVNLRSGERRVLERFRGQPVHAVAAVGHPEAFFAGLRAAGLQVASHPLRDHAALRPGALPFPADATILMTEKDAVKCRSFAGADWWFVELDVVVERAEAARLVALVLDRTGLTGAGVRLG